MANSDPLPASAVKSVAKQLGQFLAAPKAAVASTLGVVRQPELAESLAVCTITAAQVKNPPTDLVKLCQPSGRWHHQVHTATGATHMARSSQDSFSAADLQVEQWVESPIAAKLEEAMQWLDDHVPDDAAVVRLLVIPAYYVHALAILRGTKPSAVLVDQPSGFRQLESQREYPLRDFLKRLAKEQPSGTLV